MAKYLVLVEEGVAAARASLGSCFQGGGRRQRGWDFKTKYPDIFFPLLRTAAAEQESIKWHEVALMDVQFLYDLKT